MTTERFDLGPNRWMAAGGLAFVHVKIRRCLSVSISLEPVRDIRVGRARFFESYFEPISLLFFLLWGGCGFSRSISTGEVNPALGMLGQVAIFALYALIITMAYRRRGRVTFRFGREGDFQRNRLDIPGTIADQPEMVGFLQHLDRLSSAAPDERRERRRYSIASWWGTLAALLAAMAAIVALILWFIDGAQPVHAVFVALIIGSGTFLMSSERGLLFHRPLRRAQSLLLNGDVDSAEPILKEFLVHHPTHARANYLMTVAELLRGNLQLAEDLIIQNATPGICHSFFSSRISEFHLWESYHGDH